LDHSLISRETAGLFKVIADKTSKKVIGVQIVGKGAGEMISLAVLALKKGLGVSDLATISCAWPSRMQGLKKAARKCLDLLTEKRMVS
jgi:mercuric reductase